MNEPDRIFGKDFFSQQECFCHVIKFVSMMKFTGHVRHATSLNPKVSQCRASKGKCLVFERSVCVQGF